MNVVFPGACLVAYIETRDYSFKERGDTHA